MHQLKPDCRDCIHYSDKAHKADPDGYVCGCNLRPFPAQCWDSHARYQRISSDAKPVMQMQSQGRETQHDGIGVTVSDEPARGVL
jgi:hypothetical protein